jgi:hypothetical protein
LWDSGHRVCQASCSSTGGSVKTVGTASGMVSKESTASVVLALVDSLAPKIKFSALHVRKIHFSMTTLEEMVSEVNYSLFSVFNFNKLSF